MQRVKAQQFKTAREILKTRRIQDPFAYLATRYKMMQPGPEKDELAFRLMPYIHRKKAAEPVKEVREAAARASFVVVAHPDADVIDAEQ